MASRIESTSDSASKPGKRVRISCTAIAIDLASSSKYIVVSLNNKPVHVIDTKGELLHVLQHKAIVWSLALRDNILLCGEVGEEPEIRSWDLLSGLTRNTFTGHTGTVRCLTFCGLSSFVSAARDGTLKIWSLEADQSSGMCIATLSGHTAPVVSLAFDTASALIASSSKDGTCRLWNVANQGASVSTLSGHEGAVWSVALFTGVSADGTDPVTRVVTGGSDGQVKVWDTADGSLVADLEGHTGLVTHVLTVANGSEDVQTLVTAGIDGTIKAWEMGSTPCLLWAQTKAHVNGVSSVHINGEYLISGGADNQVKVWELQTGRMVKIPGVKFDAVYGVACKQGDGQGFIVVSKQNASLFLDMF